MNKAVIGLGFGDEGKGLVTDWLCSKSPNLVVRFNGGHQAGHTVVKDGYRHVFSNFGSGTLRGAPTYWSKFCTVEPRGLLRELKLLIDNGYDPQIIIDNECPVTTPYDIWHNQSRTYHGTVGVGFGSTLQREQNFYSLVFMDLFYPQVFQAKLKAIEDRYGCLNVSKVVLAGFMEACEVIRSCRYLCRPSTRITRSNRSPVIERNCVFEGAQGLLLDQHYGFFPNVTRSNTGTKNIQELTTEEFLPREFYLVTRAYQTRHGAGFMTGKKDTLEIVENPKETNIDHLYQGRFRKTILDVSLLEYGIYRDPILRDSTYTGKLNLVITCLDQINGDYKFLYHGEIRRYDTDFNFVKAISKLLEIDKIYVSHGDQAGNIKKWG